MHYTTSTTQPALLMHTTASAYKTEHTRRNESTAIHNITYSPCYQHAMHSYQCSHTTAFYVQDDPPVHLSNKTQGVVGKVAQDV